MYSKKIKKIIQDLSDWMVDNSEELLIDKDLSLQILKLIFICDDIIKRIEDKSISDNELKENFQHILEAYNLVLSEDTELQL